MPVFEVVPPEFRGDTDETDHLVKWIAAPSIDGVLNFCRRNNWEGAPSLVESQFAMSGVDFIVNEAGDVVQPRAKKP